MKKIFVVWSCVLVFIFVVAASGALSRTPGKSIAGNTISEGLSNGRADREGRNPRTSGWIVATPIAISGDGNWTSCPWVNGSGTWGDPFTITNLTIDAGGGGNCISIQNTQKPFLIANCTLLNAGTSLSGIFLSNAANGTLVNNTCNGCYNAISLSSASNNTISGNNCTGNFLNGISLSFANNNTISVNNCTGNDGINLYFASNNIISGNNCTGVSGVFGIYLGGSNNNTLSGNYLTGNSYGISLVSGSDNNILAENNCTGNYWGINLSGTSNCELISNVMGQCGIMAEGSLSAALCTTIDATNLVNGQPVRYFVNQSGAAIPANTGEVLLSYCYSTTIHQAANSSVLIALTNSANNTISGNNCTGNPYGIYLSASNNNTLSGNNCTGKSLGISYGISLVSSSNNNSLAGNNCTGNTFGFFLNVASNNTLSENNCTGNSDGIDLWFANNDTLAGNNCTGNSIGINLGSAGNDTLSGNNCTGNPYGIYLSASNNNTLSGNNCTGNSVCGIYLTTSNWTSIAGNTLRKNAGGVTLDAQSNNNAVTNNWFIKNAGSAWQNLGISNTFSNNLIIGYPVAAFTENSTAIIVGQSVAFTDTSFNGTAPLAYEWNFGDGTGNSTAQNPSHQFVTLGAFTVTLTVTDADGDATVSQGVIRSYSPLIAGFTTNATSITAGQTVQFTSTATGGIPPLAYQWNFGDGTGNSTAQNPFHQFAEAGSVTINLTVADADGDAAVSQGVITVYPSLIIVLIANATSIITGQTVQFTSTASGGNSPLAYQWYFGDGTGNSIAQNASHKFAAPGTFTVTLMVTDADGAIAVSQGVITVYLPLTTFFTANPTYITAGQLVHFTGMVSGGIPPLAYEWNFGDGTGNSTSQNPSHQFAGPGTFTVTLTVTDASGDVAVYNSAITVTSETTLTNYIWVIVVIIVIAAVAVSVWVVVRKWWAAKGSAIPPSSAPSENNTPEWLF